MLFYCILQGRQESYLIDKDNGHTILIIQHLLRAKEETLTEPTRFNNSDNRAGRNFLSPYYCT